MATNTIPSQTELANAAVNFVPAAEETAQLAAHSFLYLSPTVSDSYPTSVPKTISPIISTSSSPSVAAATGQAEGVKKTVGDMDEQLLKANAEKTRRSSSLSSEGSANGGRRFLRLGPVHGGVSGGMDGDWSEEVLE